MEQQLLYSEVDQSDQLRSHVKILIRSDWFIVDIFLLILAPGLLRVFLDVLQLFNCLITEIPTNLIMRK